MSQLISNCLRIKTVHFFDRGNCWHSRTIGGHWGSSAVQWPRDEAWGSAAVSGREGVVLGPAGCDRGLEGKSGSSLDGKSCIWDILAQGANRMLKNCQGTKASLLCIFTPLILLIGLITDCAPLVLFRLII